LACGNHTARMRREISFPCLAAQGPPVPRTTACSMFLDPATGPRAANRRQLVWLRPKAGKTSVRSFFPAATIPSSVIFVSVILYSSRSSEGTKSPHRRTENKGDSAMRYIYIKDTDVTQRFPDLRSRLQESGQLHVVAQLRISQNGEPLPRVLLGGGLKNLRGFSARRSAHLATIDALTKHNHFSCRALRNRDRRCPGIRMRTFWRLRSHFHWIAGRSCCGRTWRGVRGTALGAALIDNPVKKTIR
jgi:hypothetical protein